MRILNSRVFIISALGALLILFPADGLRALGLGEARVDSYLGQPLDVTVRLLDVESASLESLTVAPASSTDHDRLGVPTQSLALGLEVTLDRRSDPPRVRIRSQRAANDPVVQVLVDARWSNGRVLREYTLFLDPPLLQVAPPQAPASEQRPAPAEAAPATQPAEVSPRPAPAPRPAAPEAPLSEPDPRPATQPSAEPEQMAEPERRPSPPPEPAPGAIGPVEAGQTLWSIAYAWRTDTSLSMNQVMLAIFERNPQAFRDANVNRLQRGAELVMPDVADIRALNASEADRRIRDQMQAWQQDVGTREVPVVTEAAVPEVSAPRERTAQAAEPAQPERIHRLEVVPPDQEDYDDGAAVSDGEVQRLSGVLTDLEDQMYIEELESDALVRQIDSIREAIDSREAAGVAVADEELAVLSDRLRQAREDRAERDAAEALLDEGDDDEVSAYFRQLERELTGMGDDEFAGDDPALDPETGEPMLAEQDAAEAQFEEPVPDEEAPVAPTVMPRAEIGQDSGFNWLWLLIGVVVVLAIAGAVVLRRRKAGAGSSADQAIKDESQARAAIAAEPANLAAHLALLKILARKDDSDAFSAALDDMYHEVLNEEDSRWQEALDLTVVNAPDHPLLTPNETGFAESDEDGLDDRTREMLGILDRKDSESPDDYDLDSAVSSTEGSTGFSEDEDFFGAEDQPRYDEREASSPMDAEGDDVAGVDLDLAALSDRLDPNAPDDQDDSDELEESGETDPDIGGLPKDDEVDEVKDARLSDESPGSADRLETEPEPDPDQALDFDDSADNRTESAEPTLQPWSTEQEDLDGDTDEPPELPGKAPGKDFEEDAGLDFAFSDAREPDDPEDDPEIDGEDDEDELSYTAGGTLVLDEDELTGGQSGTDELERRGDEEVSRFLGQETDSDTPSDGPMLSEDDADVKLDLARAYLSMDDPDSARTLLEEIVQGSTGAQRDQARKLLDDL